MASGMRVTACNSISNQDIHNTNQLHTLQRKNIQRDITQLNHLNRGSTPRKRRQSQQLQEMLQRLPHELCGVVAQFCSLTDNCRLAHVDRKSFPQDELEKLIYTQLIRPTPAEWEAIYDAEINSLYQAVNNGGLHDHKFPRVWSMVRRTYANYQNPKPATAVASTVTVYS